MHPNVIADLQLLGRHGGISGIRTGACKAQPSVAMSWGGAGCPSGYCPPANLPEALGRWFAGDRTGCRELPLAISFTGAASGTAVEVTDNSLVTFCPTRLMAIEQGSAGVGLDNWTIDVIKFGNENQIAGDSINAAMFDPAATQPVPLVPACMRAGTPYYISCTPTTVTAPGDTVLQLIFFGPAIG